MHHAFTAQNLSGTERFPNLPSMQKRKSKRVGVYAGSFDPLTVGHLWMIEQGVQLFDRLVVAIGINPDKKYRFTLEDRMTMLSESTRRFKNVSVASFSN